MSARRDDNFRQMLRAMPMQSWVTKQRATPRVVDLSFGVMLYGPEKVWPRPANAWERIAAGVVRSRRSQSLPVRVEDQTTLARVAGLVVHAD